MLWIVAKILLYCVCKCYYCVCKCYQLINIKACFLVVIYVYTDMCICNDLFRSLSTMITHEHIIFIYYVRNIQVRKPESQRPSKNRLHALWATEILILCLCILWHTIQPLGSWIGWVCICHPKKERTVKSIKIPYWDSHFYSFWGY